MFAHKAPKIALSLLIACGISISLTGCLPMAFVAGASAGGTIIYDKRSVKTMVQDRETANVMLERINDDDALRKNTHITIADFNHLVLMTGQAPTPQLRDRAYRLVSTAPNIKRIYNEVTIEPPTTLAVQAQDSWITTKVKSEMLAQPGLKSGQIKVITENGVVFLLGIVTHKQSDLASEAARGVSGVKKVVTLFEYE